MDTKNIGKNIARLRERAGLTQTQLAVRLGLAQAAVAQWENGTTEPRLGKLDAIAEALGCQIDELLVAERRSAEA